MTYRNHSPQKQRSTNVTNSVKETEPKPKQSSRIINESLAEKAKFG